MYEVNKPIEVGTVREIEESLAGKGDYVQMSYLQRALKSGLDLETKKFVFIRLGKIYEQRRMFLDAARMVRSGAEINTTYRGKIGDFMKCVELYIWGGDYNEADRMFSQALVLGSEKEKVELKNNLKKFYLTQGKILINQNKRNNARVVFERVLKMDLDSGEREDVKDILLGLYEKLGHIREYFKLKGEI